MTTIWGDQLGPVRGQIHFHFQELPSYARPRFLRFLSDMDITGTFKHQKAGRRWVESRVGRDGFRKVQLRDQGFDPAKAVEVSRSESKWVEVSRSESK